MSDARLWLLVALFRILAGARARDTLRERADHFRRPPDRNPKPAGCRRYAMEANGVR